MTTASDAKERLSGRETERRNLGDVGARTFCRVTGQSQAAGRC